MASCSRDHPRVCGKNLCSAITRRLVSGSPPRVREKHHHWTNRSSNLRITPACAGKTLFFNRWIFVFGDHPRVCGKNIGAGIAIIVASGSPPRVREKQSIAYSLATSIRITPACAGKTWPLCLKEIKERDHPRVCGKNGFLQIEWCHYLGSPPRVREKPGHYVWRK